MNFKYIILEQIISEGRLEDMIKKYDVDGKSYGLIPTFREHQRLSGKEAQDGKKYPVSDAYCEATISQPGSVGEATGKQPGSVGERQESQERKGKERRVRKSADKTPLPQDFTITDKVKEWAARKGYTCLDEHLESFRAKCKANGYRYVDWDAALMEAIRGDWAKLGERDGHQANNRSIFAT